MGKGEKCFFLALAFLVAVPAMTAVIGNYKGDTVDASSTNIPTSYASAGGEILSSSEARGTKNVL